MEAEGVKAQADGVKAQADGVKAQAVVVKAEADEARVEVQTQQWTYRLSHPRKQAAPKRWNALLRERRLSQDRNMPGTKRVVMTDSAYDSDSDSDSDSESNYP
jgi:hypothetical protein